MTNKQIAEKILRETKEAMSIHEIASHAIRKDYSDNLDEESLAKSIGSAISTDINKNKLKSLFRNVKNKSGKNKKGVYKLKREKTDNNQQVISVLKKANGKIPQVTTTYIGKGGEYAVMSELLYRGYNANIMSVDDGIDIIASKGAKFFYIQVKTTHYNSGRISLPGIKRDRFEKFQKHDTYYIFVIRYYLERASRNEFIIFKHSDLERFITTKFIDEDKAMLQLNLLIEENNFYIQKNGKKEDISYYFNNFELIK
jgi:Holliday junction resolvase-like predicted endonuclease